jgi:2-methylcitrate dehydratase PrpD
MEHAPDIDARATSASEANGFSLAKVLSSRSLDGVSFEGYVMSFPAQLTMHTSEGREYAATQDVPLGAAGRSWEETEALVKTKFTSNFAGDDARAQEALAVVDHLEALDDVRELTKLLSV